MLGGKYHVEIVEDCIGCELEDVARASDLLEFGIENGLSDWF